MAMDYREQREVLSNYCTCYDINIRVDINCNYSYLRACSSFFWNELQ